MDKSIKILLEVNDPGNSDLVISYLEDINYPFNSKLADSETEFVKQLIEFDPDVLITDHTLSRFKEIKTFDYIDDKLRHIPFIIILKPEQEPEAIKYLKEGADDYILENNLSRLRFSIESARRQKDLLRRKEEVEKELRDNGEQLRLAFQSSADAINITRMSDGVYVDVSDAFTHLTNYTREEVIGKSSLELNIWADPADRARLVKELKEKGKVTNLEAKFRTKDGRLLTGLMSANVLMLNGEPHIISATRIIEELKQAELALKISEKKYRDLFELSEDAFLVISNGRFIDCNPATVRMLGYKEKNELLNTHPSELSPEFQPDGKKSSEKADEMMRTAFDKGSHRFEWNHKKADGTVFPVEVLLTAINFDGNDKILHTVWRDITDRKKAETELRESKNRYQQLIELAVDGILLGSKDGIIIGANTYMLNLVEMSHDELIGKHISAMFSHEEIKEKPFRFDLLDKGETVINERNMLCPDGKTVPIEMHSKRMPDGSYQAIIRDITERREAEEKILNANRIYALISQINQTIVRLNDPEAILKEACGIAVEFGKFHMSWVGLLDESTKLLHPVYSAGVEKGYLGILKKNSDKMPEGRGPMGDSIRAGKTYVCNDIENDSVMAPWKNEALSRGYRSAIALPIKIYSKVFGAFCLYSTRAFFFDKKEIELLDEVTRDISFALEAIETEKMRREAEDKLIESESKFHTAFENAATGMTLTSLDGKLLQVNKAFCELLGYSREQLNNMPFSELTHPDDVKMSMGYAAGAVMKNEDVLQFEKRYIHKNGSVIWTVVSSSLLKDANNKPLYFIAQVNDITERKKAEESLKESEERFRNLVENINEVFYISNAQGKIIYVSPNIVSTTGYSPEEIVGLSYLRLVAPEDRKRVSSFYMEQAAKGVTDTIFEYRVRTKSGLVIWAEQITRIILDSSGNVIEYRNVARDISDRKKAELKLKESEDRYRDLFENSSDLFCTHSLDGRLLMINKAAEKMTGYTRAELLKMRLQDLIVPKFRPLFEKYLTRIKTTGQAEGIMSIRNKAGENRFWIYNNSLRTKGVDEPLVRGIARDVTEQKIAESELQRSKNELQEFFDEDISGDYLSTPAGKIIRCNKTFIKMFGFGSEKEALNFPLEKLYHSKESRDNLISLIKNNKKIELYENEFVTIDGRIIYTLVNAAGEFDDKGDLVRIRGYIVDVSKRRKANEEIRKLSRALEQSPVSVIITDPEGNIEYVNEMLCRITGYTKEEVLGKNPRIFRSGYQGKEFYKNLWDTVLAGHDWKGEMNNRKKSGEFYWESVLISPLIDNDGAITHFVAVKEDITDRKRSREELLEAKERAEEMNRVKNSFLANMSHELRTPLIGILGYAEYLEGAIKEKDLLEMAKTIRLSGKRLNKTLNNILDISKIESEKQDINLAKMNLLKLLREQVKLFTPVAVEKGLQLNFETGKRTLPAYIDEELFLSIIDNLLSNAIKYTKKGSITVTAGREDNYAVIDVTDTGMGVPKDLQRIIFEPFRQASEGFGRRFEGTGLGLTIVKKYTDLLGGTISLKSRLHRGSTFTLKIPVKRK